MCTWHAGSLKRLGIPSRLVFHDCRGFFQGVVNLNFKVHVHDISCPSLNRLGILSRLGFHEGVVN
jgi:hypothetical protein